MSNLDEQTLMDRAMAIFNIEDRGRLILAKSLRALMLENHGLKLEGDRTSFRWVQVRDDK